MTYPEGLLGCVSLHLSRHHTRVSYVQSLAQFGLLWYSPTRGAGINECAGMIYLPGRHNDIT